jgi:hypothetical protein
MAVACQNRLESRFLLQKLAGFLGGIQFEIFPAVTRVPQVSWPSLVRGGLGVRPGDINFCFQALPGVGWAKMQNLSLSKSQRRYADLLAPAGRLRS